MLTRITGSPIIANQILTVLACWLDSPFVIYWVVLLVCRDVYVVN